MNSTRSFTFSCLALIALVALSGQAFAANYAAVGACTPPNPVTPAHTYATIQLAVTSSAPGTVIQICPGIYPEQVVVTIKTNSHRRPQHDSGCCRDCASDNWPGREHG